MSMGVAISTTGDEHRLAFLETAVPRWDRARKLGDVLVVTVDGTQECYERVREAVKGAVVVRVAQPLDDREIREGRLGVAANKNTGLEFLMASGVEHLFLSDDDIWPRTRMGVNLHIGMSCSHSMVCWGRHRVERQHTSMATWSWPRGSLLYVRRHVVEKVGGMVEAFGPGGHEHVEWSRRIHEAGITPHPYVSPAIYAARGGMGASQFWAAADMPLHGEPLGDTRQRRQKITSVRRVEGDWERIETLMDDLRGRTDFVPYTAEQNGRTPATLY